LDFSLSEEQQLLKKTVREFAESELQPHSREWDEKQEFPREVFTKLGEMGLMGVVWPVEYGGAGMTTLDYAIVMEELSRVDAGVALSLAAQQPHPATSSSRGGKEVPPAPWPGREGGLLGAQEQRRLRCWGQDRRCDGGSWVWAAPDVHRQRTVAGAVVMA
jgi:alkylation response protein AidB-like acyl-CoA dehydrogenase